MNVNRIHKLALAAISLVLAASFPANANLTTFDNKADFSATGAAVVADFGSTIVSPAVNSLSVGSLTFTKAGGATGLDVKERTSLLVGTDLAIWAREDFDVALNLGGGQAHSFGFEFVEPSHAFPGTEGPSATFVDSTFTVTLLLGSTTVGSFTFNAPNDQAAFVGVWSTADQGFNKVQIRETTGGNENEFFGDFYAGTLAHTPLPGAVLLGMLGLGAAGLKLRRLV